MSGVNQTVRVNHPDFGIRTLRRQIEVMIDFPQSIQWSDVGDSGSVVVDGQNRAVGLHWGHGFDNDAARERLERSRLCEEL